MNDNYLSNRLSLETNVDRAGILDCQILVYNNGGDIKIKEWCLSNLSNKITYFESLFVKKNSEVLNELLEHVERDFIVIVPDPVILPENWLFELVKSNDTIISSGISSIVVENKELNLTSKLNCFDENVFVYQSNENLVNGVICFKSTILNIVGGFDSDLNSGYEYYDYSYRVGLLGLSNFYITCVSGSKIKHYEPLGYSSTFKDFVEKCKVVSKNKKIQIPFRKKSLKVDEAYKNIENLVIYLKSNKKNHFYNQVANNFGINLLYLNKEDLGIIDVFCTKNGLNYVIKSEIERGLTIYFYENEQQNLYQTN